VALHQRSQLSQGRYTHTATDNRGVRRLTLGRPQKPAYAGEIRVRAT
jgi:hypothetical protein